MLFDLKGKRRRAVQGTYLTLAVLMGAGLVLFGIGSSVNGGLSDLFNGGNGSNSGDKALRKKVDAAQKVLATDPANRTALTQVIKGSYQLASGTETDPKTKQLNADGRKDAIAAASAWQRYLGTKPAKPYIGLARVMVQAYSALAQGVSNDQATSQRYWAGASGTIELIAAAQPTPANYLALVQYATLAGQTNKADLAGKKAVSLAPKKQRKTVQQQVASTKAQATSQGGGGAAATPTPAGP
jgi:hypothetical protein